MTKQRSSKPAVTEPLINRIPDRKKKQDDDISDAEKFRLMEQTGLLHKVKKREAELKAERTSTAVYFWQALFMSIPFGFLLGTFEVTVKVQYSEPWSYGDIPVRALKSVPALLPFVYLTNRHKTKKFVQVFMAIGSAVAGAFLMYTLHNSPSLGQMLRAPGLATIWVYFIVQLDLLPAMITLSVVGLYWFFGLRRK